MNALTALTYLLAGWASLQVVLPPNYVSVIFLAAGIGTGAVLVGGNRLLPGVYLGALGVQILAHRQVGLSPVTLIALCVPLGATVQAWASATWIRRRIGYPTSLDVPAQVVRLLFVYLPLSSVISATVAVPTLVLSHITAWDKSLLIWLNWWLGDTLGAALVVPVMLALFGQPAVAWRPRLKTVALPILCAMLMIGGVLSQLNSMYERTLQEQFDKVSQDLVLRMQRRLDAQTDAVVALGKLAELTPDLRRADFESATRPWLQRYAGTQNFGWSPFVAHAARIPYESGSLGWPGHEILGRDSNGQTARAPDAASYLPLTWVEPLESNRSVVGLDIGVLPATRDTVQATRRSLRPEVTEGIRLVQESGEQRGVVIYLAVYQPPGANDNARDASRPLKGVVSSVFRMDDVVHSVLGSPNPDWLQLCLFDQQAPAGERLLAGRTDCAGQATAEGLTARWHAALPLRIGSREWTLQVQAGPQFWSSGNAANHWLIAAISLLAVSILGAFLLVISGQGRRTSQQVEERTQELALSNASLMQLAHFDTLTGLTNRSFWIEQAEATLSAARLNGKEVAVIFLDLDRFKHVNDSLGHSQGDLMLKTVADRLHACLRTRDVLARWGGDEFVALLPWVKGRDGAEVVANKIARVLSDPVPLYDHEITVTASLGVAMFPVDGDSVEALLRHADTAMYSVKDSGRNSWSFFSPEMREHVTQRLTIESGLRRVLASDQGELRLEYQPQVDTRTGRITGLEALLRWTDPELGTVPPGAFIPVAEETGLIEELGAWVLRNTCRQIQSWHSGPHADLFRHLRVSVNVSALEFKRPMFLQHLKHALSCMGQPAHRLELEITESLLIQAGPDLNEKLHTITGLGISLALDDFGTGYSSLGYLKRLPLSRLKIDRSFLQDIPGDAEDEAIVRATLSMASDLGLEVVAEGVENSAQLDFMRRHGCQQLQGWLFSKALPPAQLEAWLVKHHQEQQLTGNDAPLLI
ncbi:MAG TPA: EAL domain-containing protein [Macromonas sp.]|nr:EAL domain-containing protein [Macromonas sp.]